MNLTIARIGNDTTVKYALDELMRLLRKMDKHAFIDGRVYGERVAERKDILWIGLDGSVPASDLDEILIDVKDGAGIITGSNERSVLIAVYRLMYELGCRFLRPGRDCEDVPERNLDGIMNVSVREQASYRHRGVCIEGANSYEHLCNMVDWLPKVGLNGYFRQMHNPCDFFTRFYNADNPYLPMRHITEEECMNIWEQVEHEISKRKLDYHAVGHGWTCVPFGITKDNIPEEARDFIAIVNGERVMRGGNPLWTNLCYSKKIVRDTMNDAVVEYCKEHRNINFMHFWLADGSDWHCECEECQKMTPSDYYVLILNELDEKLEAAGLDTKIVCLIYCDLMWLPEKLKIKNPDRFVLMFAPIDRTYTTTFADFDENEKFTIPPYERNKTAPLMPKSVAGNVAMLKAWQEEQLSGDSFDFDYHLMWDHYVDPGYYECARVLHDDMVSLEKIGLRGMVSCQGQRVAFPTGLPMYGMAKALWNKTSKFEDVCEEYFTSAFGEDAKAVEEYLAKISNLFCPSFTRGEKPITHEQMIEQCKEAKRVVDNFCVDYIYKNAKKDLNWEHLACHADYCRLYADVITAYTLNDEAKIKEAIDAFDDYLARVEPIIGDFYDRFNMKFLYTHQFKNCSK